MTNRLADETSPYLLQHADNPVDWWPWCDDALDLARETGKPIMLSIGYSACHWCHVMAHESFEDRGTADLMNDLFVNIKVDREERPDLDKIYQTAHQLFTGRPGGWPLTVFLTPDRHLPIFTGTYFPKSASHGMPAYRDVLSRVAEFFRDRRDDVDVNGRRLLEAFESLNAGSARASEPDAAPLDAARRNLAAGFDNVNGGFGDAPKFPHPSNLDLLLEDWRFARDNDADRDTSLEMATLSLDRMAARGLYDHLGGGFFRYCVDRSWTIPHFEKMLYDNAALLGTYADAYAATGRQAYRQVAEGTAAWITAEMQAEHGGYYSTLDADSDGHEGAFYVWRPDQLEALLEPDELAVAAAHFGLTKSPNFEGSAWHLQIAETAEALGARGDLPRGRIEELLESARAKLLAERNRRVRPGRDEKSLAAWNGLMIAAMARASRRLAAPELASAATRALDFARAELWDGRRLKACFKDGRARFDAYLDDYAFLAAGAIELLQCRWRDGDLELARQLLDVVLERFADPRGGFYFTADDHEQLLYRPKPLADEATPSGNGIAALALLELGHLLGEQRYLDAADGAIRAALPVLDRYPEAHATLLRALLRRLEPPQILVVRGDGAELEAWQARLDRAYRPALTSLFIPAECESLPGLLAERAPGNGPRAYLCRGMHCEAPVSNLETLTAMLD